MVSRRELKQISREVYKDLTNHYKHLKETRKRKGVGKTPSSFPKECSSCENEVKLAYMVYNHKKKKFTCIDCYMKYLNENIEEIKKKKLEKESFIDNNMIKEENNEPMRTGDPELDSFLNDYLTEADESKKTPSLDDATENEILEDIKSIKRVPLVRETVVKKFDF